MRKASKILFLVAAIVSVVVAVQLLFLGIFFIVFTNTQAFVEFAEQAAIDAPGSDIAQFTEALRVVFISTGISCFIGCAFAVVNSVFSFKAHAEEKPSTALCVLNIIFSAFSGVIINIVGAIFALICNNQEDNVEVVENQ